jgi:hypothetical protein
VGERGSYRPGGQRARTPLNDGAYSVGPGASFGFDTIGFAKGLRDLFDGDDTTDEQIAAKDSEMRAAGADDKQIVDEYSNRAKRQATVDYAQQRREAMKRYTDATQQSQAAAEAETGVQSVFRLIAELGNAYNGGQPGAISEKLREIKARKQARQDKIAGSQLDFELEGIDREQTDARAAATADGVERRHRETITAGDERSRLERDAQAQRAEFDRQQRTKEAGLDRTSRENIARDNRAAAEARAKSGANAKPRPSQYKAADFAVRMEQALADYEAAGGDRASLASATQSMLPNAVRSSERQRMDQAEENFVTAVLRPESGALIGKEEMERDRVKYFPRVGNSPEVVAQKARLRQIAMKGLAAQAGPAYDELKAELAGTLTTGGPPDAGAAATYEYTGKDGTTLEIDFEAGDPELDEFLDQYPDAVKVR